MSSSALICMLTIIYAVDPSVYQIGARSPLSTAQVPLDGSDYKIWDVDQAPIPSNTNPSDVLRRKQADINAEKRENTQKEIDNAKEAAIAERSAKQRSSQAIQNYNGIQNDNGSMENNNKTITITRDSNSSGSSSGSGSLDGDTKKKDKVQLDDLATESRENPIPPQVKIVMEDRRRRGETSVKDYSTEFSHNFDGITKTGLGLNGLNVSGFQLPGLPSLGSSINDSSFVNEGSAHNATNKESTKEAHNATNKESTKEELITGYSAHGTHDGSLCPLGWNIVGNPNKDQNHYLCTPIYVKLAAGCPIQSKFTSNSDRGCHVTWNRYHSMDFISEPCPVGWEIQQEVCIPPSEKKSGDSLYSDVEECQDKGVSIYAPITTRERFYQVCKVEWPCGTTCCPQGIDLDECPLGYQKNESLCRIDMIELLKCESTTNTLKHERIDCPCGEVDLNDLATIADAELYMQKCNVVWPCKQLISNRQYNDRESNDFLEENDVIKTAKKYNKSKAVQNILAGNILNTNHILAERGPILDQNIYKPIST